MTPQNLNKYRIGELEMDISRQKTFISLLDAVFHCLIQVQHRIRKKGNLDVIKLMKVATKEKHIIKEILVGARVKRATSKKDSGK